MKTAFALAVALLLAGCDMTATPTIEHGVVLAAAPADQPGENTGAGAVAGMVIGGVAGGQVGEGAGKAVAVVGGIIAGQIAGTAAESAAQPHGGIAYTIRLDDGQVLTILQHLGDGDAVPPVGAPIILEINGSEQTVEAAST